MNKKTKGLISGLVGASLLFGTAGTFALWFDTAAFGTDADTISTGNLALDSDAAGNWVWANVSNPTNRGEGSLVGQPLLATDLLVPGDAVSATFTLGEDTVVLEGETIEAELRLVDTTTGNTVGGLPADFAVIVSGSGALAGLDWDTPVAITPDAEGSVTVTVGFIVRDTAQAPYSANLTGTAALDISNFEVHLVQTVTGAYFGSN